MRLVAESAGCAPAVPALSRKLVGYDGQTMKFERTIHFAFLSHPCP